MVGPIKAFAWPWLVQAARLAEPRGSKLALTKAGHVALGKPPAESKRTKEAVLLIGGSV